MCHFECQLFKQMILLKLTRIDCILLDLNKILILLLCLMIVTLLSETVIEHTKKSTLQNDQIARQIDNLVP